MIFSGKQKHQFEIQITKILADFGNVVQDLHLKYQTRGIRQYRNAHRAFMTELSRETTKAMNKIMQLFVNQQHNHGPTGQLRGFIRRVRDKISYVDKKTQQRVPLRDTEVNKALYDAYNEVLGATKLQLNGENILSPPICDYEDKEEKFYCMETVGYGYKYCLDHWIIIKEMKKNSGLEISD